MFSQFQNLDDIKRETFLAESRCKESENEQVNLPVTCPYQAHSIVMIQA